MKSGSRVFYCETAAGFDGSGKRDSVLTFNYLAYRDYYDYAYYGDGLRETCWEADAECNQDAETNIAITVVLVVALALIVPVLCAAGAIYMHCFKKSKSNMYGKDPTVLAYEKEMKETKKKGAKPTLSEAVQSQN